jgi:hypothetical protein
VKLRLLANATLLGLFLLPLAHAQMPFGLKGNIPFEFRINDKTLPAGEYTLGSVVHGSRLLSMQKFDRTGPGVVFASNAVQAKSAQATKLIFPSLWLHLLSVGGLARPG